MIIHTDHYEAIPLSFNLDTPDRTATAVWKNAVILNRCAAHENYFTDYIRGCPNGECNGFCNDLSPTCAAVKDAVRASILKPDTMTWEVWSKGDDGVYIDFMGILRLERINLGCDAVAHYFFFDGKLTNKTELLQRWLDWGFSDSADWVGLHRVTIEVPTYAYALAKHAARHMGFGGPYTFKHKRSTLQVEGVRKDALLWRGEWHSLLTLGKINEDK